jgi:putative sterol carrier protein
MDLAACTQKLQGKIANFGNLGAVLKFDCGADGVVVIDGKATPVTVDNTNRDADCTISITQDKLSDLIDGELNPITGFMSGAFTVAGDMSIAMKLNSLVG